MKKPSNNIRHNHKIIKEIQTAKILQEGLLKEKVNQVGSVDKILFYKWNKRAEKQFSSPKDQPMLGKAQSQKHIPSGPPSPPGGHKQISLKFK